MTNPVRERQLAELDLVNTCVQIFYQARNELYLNMRFLDLSLSSLGFEADYGLRGLACDGFLIYYEPEYLTAMYKQGRVKVNRAYLHMVFHCLFSHIWGRKNRDERYWNLACDIAAESMIDGIYKKCVHIKPSMFRRETYQRLKKELQVLNAEGVAKALAQMEFDERQLARLEEEFYVDDHGVWSREMPPRQAMERQTRWDDNREKMQTEMETMGTEQDEDDTREFMEQVQVRNRQRYDYRQFLRRFSVLKEEIQIDEDSFDYIFYTYGLSLYGNMPLVEPLESKEVSRIEDFVIVIDTSMSCQGQLVLRFLEETYGVLSESESFFRKINIHIIQCDEQVQDDVTITSKEEMEAYMESFTIKGNGGTDFRPAFEYVNGLVGKGRFQRLRGMIYFTDGKGIYPVQMPVYDTAFVFIKDLFQDESVPAWAMKVILTPEELEEMG